MGELEHVALPVLECLRGRPVCFRATAFSWFFYFIILRTFLSSLGVTHGFMNFSGSKIILAMECGGEYILSADSHTLHCMDTKNLSVCLSAAPTAHSG